MNDNEAHTNRMVSFPSLFKRGPYSNRRRVSPQCPGRFGHELAVRHNACSCDTAVQI